MEKVSGDELLRVGVSRIPEYRENEMRSAVVRALDAAGCAVPAGLTVLIKPNCMARNRPEQHTVTHWTLVAALASLLRDNGCRIIIGEASAFYQRGITRTAFEKARIGEVAKRFDARLVPFEEERLARVEIPGLAFPGGNGTSGMDCVYIPKIILDVDLVLNAPKLKSHGPGFRLSGAIKNLFGLLPGGYKQLVHRWLRDDMDACALIVGLHRIIPGELCVMDAVIGLDGGPSAIGKPVRVGAVLASENAAALDTVACAMIGYEPDEVPLLAAAKAAGMLGSFDEVVVSGDVPPTAVFRRLHRGPFPGAHEKESVFITDTYVTPVVKSGRCDGCGECRDFCPVGAIRVPQHVAQSRTEPMAAAAPGEAFAYSVDDDRCIRCYLCLSACPKKAVSYRSTLMNKTIRFFWKTLGL